MPSSSGPNTLGESNLVFAYDTGDVKNSYRGEPTVNYQADIAPWTVNGTNTDVTGTSEQGPVKGAKTWKFEKSGGSNQWNGWESNYGGIWTGNAGDVWTTSYWYKTTAPAGNTGFGVGYFYKPDWSAPYSSTILANESSIIADGQWHYNYTTTQINENYSNAIIVDGPSWGYSYSAGVLYINGLQWEKKSHATPFVNSTRSVTQGLLPVIGNSTIDLTNVSFDSNAKMVFDGTNDYIAAGNPTDYRMGVSNFTLECVMKQSKTSVHCLLESRGDSLAGYLWVHNYSSTGQSCLFLNYGGNQYLYFQDGGFVATTTTQYYHMAIVVNRAGNTISFYVNGNKAGNDVAIHSNSISPTGGDIYRVGFDLGGSPWQGEIPIFKHYNRTLSAQELKQNYQQYKTRFNLS
jgi:hypothetical protein